MAGSGEKYYGQRNYGVGIGNVGSYQVSGIPFLTGALNATDGTETHVKFPYVTKSITVINTGSVSNSRIRIGFDSFEKNGRVEANRNFIELANDQDSLTMNVKCKEVYVQVQKANSGFQMFAELTNIPTGNMYTLTGSGINDP